MTLRSDLAAWDGVQTSYMSSLYERVRTRRDLVSTLVKLTSDPECERGATWLLKHHVERAEPAPSPMSAGAFYAALPSVTHWESRLHMLQCMHAFPIPTSKVRTVRRVVEQCMADENKFVRAWSYSGLHALADAHPKYRSEATELIEDGSQADVSAAVRARCRQLLKKKFKD